MKIKFYQGNTKGGTGNGSLYAAEQGVADLGQQFDIVSVSLTLEGLNFLLAVLYKDKEFFSDL